MLGITSIMIAIISGTNRKGNNSIKIAREVKAAYDKLGHEAEILDLQELPAEAFSPEIYGEKPAALTEEFTDKVLAADGLVVVVAEYNGSFPGILKYFIDLLPFPESFDKRPVAFIGLAAGYHGALRAVEQLQMVFAYRNAWLFNRRVFIPGVYKILDNNGSVTDQEVSRRLAEQAEEFSEFVLKLGN
jgi:NAD(P)H-dependent FMN reductase